MTVIDRVLQHPYVVTAAQLYYEVVALDVVVEPDTHESDLHDGIALQLHDALRMADAEAHSLPALLAFRCVQVDGRPMVRVHGYSFASDAEPEVHFIAVTK